MNKEIVKQLLLDAGITPLDDDINTTTDLLNVLTKQSDVKPMTFPYQVILATNSREPER